MKTFESTITGLVNGMAKPYTSLLELAQKGRLNDPGGHGKHAVARFKRAQARHRFGPEGSGNIGFQATELPRVRPTWEEPARAGEKRAAERLAQERKKWEQS